MYIVKRKRFFCLNSYLAGHSVGDDCKMTFYWVKSKKKAQKFLNKESAIYFVSVVAYTWTGKPWRCPGALTAIRWVGDAHSSPVLLK